MAVSSLTFLLTLFFIWIQVNFIFVKSSKPPAFFNEEATVTILVPLRNEERNVKELVHALRSLTYPKLQFKLLDDQSTDGTWNLLTQLTSNDDRFELSKGSELPKEWVGKVYACHTLSKDVNTDYLFFFDADLRMHPQTIEVILPLFKKNTGLISGFPSYPLKGFFGHLLVPMQHFIIYAHLPMVLANKTRMVAASAAHGAFMAFKTEAYHNINGHASVAKSMTEDIDLAKEMKRNGWNVELINNTSIAACKMYDSNKEVWEGFSKNIYPGIGKNPFIAVSVAVMYAVLFFSPLPLALSSIFVQDISYTFPYFLTVLISGSIHLRTNQKWWLSFTFPIAALLTIFILINSMYLFHSNRGFTWKGRRYH